LKSPGFVPPRVTLLIVSALVPLFVRVATFCPPIPPTDTETQFRFVGATDAVPPVVDAPVPVSATVCGLPVPESAKLRVALRVPLAVGLNTTEAEQVPDAARLVPHDLLEMLKSPAFVPVIATLLIVIDDAVPFLRVADCAALAEPTLILANVSAEGLAETPPPGAKPVRATACGVLVAESLKFSVAERFPGCVGAKTTFAVQLAPAARLDPHVFE
jgi:hypothetical protein